MLPELILLSLMLCLSAIFSGSETALLSINSGKLESLKNDSPLFYQKIKRFTEFPYRFLLFILLSNTVVNVGFASSAEKFFSTYTPLSFNGVKFELIVFAITTFVLVIFGEVAPKAVAINHPEKFLKISNTIIAPLSYLIFPILKFFGFLETFFSNIITIIKPYSLERESLESFAEVVSHNTKIDKGQRVFLKIAYGLDSIFNTSVMRAITNLPTEINTENIKRVNSGEIPFIVVLSDKTGEPHTIHTATTGLKKRTKDDEEFVLVLSYHSVYSTLKKLLKSNKEYAIVIDEYGMWKGYIEYSHIFSFISRDFGGKTSTTSTPENAVFDASETLAQVTADYGYKFIQGNYTTINGYITAKLGFIPQQGFEFESDGLKIEILDSTATKTKKVKITKL